MYHISFTDQDVQKEYVIRLFSNRKWLEEEPDLARHEAESLRYVAQIDLPTPEIIAHDDQLSEQATPFVMMTFLNGEVQLKPEKMEHWIDQLAKTLVKIHQLDGEGFEWNYAPYQNINTFDVPTWTSVPHLWKKAIQIAKGPQQEEKTRFIHRDYHPAKVLWNGDEISGVVDWVNACRGPAGIDIGHCRVNLALLYSVEVADLFLKHYERHVERVQENQMFWDLRSVIDISFGPPTVYPGWKAFGVTRLTDSMMEKRLDLYMKSLFENK